MDVSVAVITHLVGRKLLSIQQCETIPVLTLCVLETKLDASAWRNQSPPVSLSASRKRFFAEEVIWSFHGYLQVHLLECQYPKQTNILYIIIWISLIFPEK